MKSSNEFRTTDGFEPGDLLRFAVDHRNAALHLYRTSPDFFDSAGYLGHLSVELALKSVLLAHTGAFPKVHRLGILWAKVHRFLDRVAFDDTFAADLVLLAGGEDLRYPTPNAPTPAGHRERDALVSVWKAFLRGLSEDDLSLFAGILSTKKGGRVLMTRRIGSAGSKR